MAPPATPPTTAPIAAPSHPPAIAPMPAPTAAPPPAPIAVRSPGVAQPPRAAATNTTIRKCRIGPLLLALAHSRSMPALVRSRTARDGRLRCWACRKTVQLSAAPAVLSPGQVSKLAVHCQHLAVGPPIRGHGELRAPDQPRKIAAQEHPGRATIFHSRIDLDEPPVGVHGDDVLETERVGVVAEDEAVKPELGEANLHPRTPAAAPPPIVI